jgi:hypothetical protein
MKRSRYVSSFMSGATKLRVAAGVGAAALALLLPVGATAGAPAGTRAARAATTPLDAALARDLAAGTQARAQAMLRRGHVDVQVQAPEKGLLTIEWAAPLARARVGKLGPPALVFAHGTLDFAAPGRGTLAIALTHAGHVLLAHVRRPRLSTWVTFTVPGEGVQALAENFTVRR